MIPFLLPFTVRDETDACTSTRTTFWIIWSAIVRNVINEKNLDSLDAIKYFKFLIADFRQVNNFIFENMS